MDTSYSERVLITSAPHGLTRFHIMVRSRSASAITVLSMKRKGLEFQRLSESERQERARAAATGATRGFPKKKQGSGVACASLAHSHMHGLPSSKRTQPRAPDEAL